jgi:hypothetical protein
MAHLDDELAVRGILTDLTAGQPPAPPGRYASVRRHAIARRRRQLAGAAAAVVLLVAAAIAIPLGVLHVGPTPPTTRPRHYHVSVSPPGPGARRGLVASGVVDGRKWQVTVQHEQGVTGYCYTYAAGLMNCDADPLPRATSSGDPVSFTGSAGTADPVSIGTVRSDVAYFTMSFTNGQVLTLHPVDVLGRRYARFFAIEVPYDAAVTEVTAYSRHSELAYAIPFTALGSVEPVRWLQPAQADLTARATYQIGSGTVSGKSWRARVYVGPWGTCVSGGGGGGGSECFASTGSLLPAHAIASGFGYAVGPEGVYYITGEAAPSVSYLVVTGSAGSTWRVPVVAAGTRKFFAYTSPHDDKVVRWAAYGADGQKLGSGTGVEP